MGELTFSLGLQVKQQPDGIFISQDKYVADILKKFDFLSIRTTTTPIESNKPLVKDKDGIDVDVDVYRISMDLRMDRSCAANSTHIWYGQLWIKVKAQHNQLNPITHLLIQYHPHPNHLFHHHLIHHHHLTHPLPPPVSPPYFSPPRSYEVPLPEGNTSRSAEDSMQLKELMDIVPKLVTRIETLETELQQTKTTYGKAVLTLVNRVKLLEKALKRKTQKVVVSESEGEEPEDQGRIIQDIDDDPLVSLVRESMKMKEKSTDFVTPTKDSGEAQEEDISPTILEAAKTLSKVASQGVSKVKSTDKGKRYRRRARSVAKIINTRLDAEEEINTGIEE
ncbi:hypothetical protein Tco_1133038, partial [Tanacetum coccineum]